MGDYAYCNGRDEYDYRIFKEDSKVKVLITNIRR